MSTLEATHEEGSSVVLEAADRPQVAEAVAAPVVKMAREAHRLRKATVWVVAVALTVLAGVWSVPKVLRTLNTFSTDDAYVNGHVTFVAPRVGGEIAKVFVEGNNRVRQGDVLVHLDKEPYQVQVGISKAALGATEADVVHDAAFGRGERSPYCC